MTLYFDNCTGQNIGNHNYNFGGELIKWFANFRHECRVLSYTCIVFIILLLLTEVGLSGVYTRLISLTKILHPLHMPPIGSDSNGWTR